MAEIKLALCENCQGSGQVSGRECPACFGYKRFYFANNNFYYWDWPIDYLHIFVRELKEVISLVINIFLIGSVIFTGILLYLILNQTDIYPLSIVQFFSQAQVDSFWLFVLISFNMYLYYRLKYPELKEKARHKKLKDSDTFVKHNLASSLNKETVLMLDKAWLYARYKKVFPLGVWQLLHTLLNDKDIKLVLARLGLGAANLQQTISEQIAQLVQSSGDSENIQPDLQDALLNAYLHMITRRDQRISEVDLLYGLVVSSSSIRNFFYDLDVDEDKIDNVITWLSINKELYQNYQRFRSLARYKPKNDVNRAFTAIATPILDAFSQDLTRMSRAGHLGLCVARERETQAILEMIEGGLSSVILVGAPGTGKTNIIEGLAGLMVAEEVPKLFQDKRLVSISLPALISGAAGSGQLEERILAILNEVVISGNIILFIENIHNLVGVSSQNNQGIDLSEVLSSEINKNKLIVIATTTQKHYTETIENSELGNTFKKIIVVEPDKNQTIKMMEAHVGGVEAKHKVYFTYEAIEKIYELANRYIPDTALPQKAIDLLDEVGIMVAQTRRSDKLVRAEDVAKIVSKKTNIPLTQVTTQESAKLLNLEQDIHQRVIGQDEAVKYVASALRRARAELRDKKRPIVNLLFLGPTGVGKTELAKTVAQVYFGDEKNMIRLDMSEYQSQSSLSRLIGSTENSIPGLLTEAVRHKPFALLLLDEIEKAHKDILNIFLQVMDDGRLTDALGRTVDFTNLIVVATSNAGTGYIQDRINEGKSVDSFKDDLIKNEIRPIFSPEFINRFDGTIVFKPLNTEEIFKITGLMLKQVKQRLETKGIFFEITEEAQRELATIGFDPIFGARPLRRVIQERVDDALANFLLTGKVGRRDVIVYEVGGKLTIKKAQGY